MEKPKMLQVPLIGYDGYYMELDTEKRFCGQESPHWHLCRNGRRIGQITADGRWVVFPTTNINNTITQTAEWLTDRYSKTIIERYSYNKEYGL